MHTQDTAQQLWCPMVRALRTGPLTYPGAYNRVVGTSLVEMDMIDKAAPDAALKAAVVHTAIDSIPASAKCIAGSCAMWRWATPHPALTRITWGLGLAAEDMPTSEPKRSFSVPADAVWIPYDGEPDSGQWAESPEKFSKRTAAHDADRKGFCGLAGFPISFTG
jgi:hypothetical protein